MSLDLDRIGKCITAGTFAAGLTAGPVDADLLPTGSTMQDVDLLTVYIDTTAGDVTVTMAQLDALTGVADGVNVQLKKTDTTPNKIIFVDGDGVSNEFVNRQTEYYCVKRWGAGNWLLA